VQQTPAPEAVARPKSETKVVDQSSRDQILSDNVEERVGPSAKGNANWLPLVVAFVLLPLGYFAGQRFTAVPAAEPASLDVQVYENQEELLNTIAAYEQKERELREQETRLEGDISRAETQLTKQLYIARTELLELTKLYEGNEQ